jgi:ATP-dependent exoDNAse (exonuclease V) alpha subunit
MLIEMTDSIACAYSVMEKTNKNVFLTGRAGTGKSTLLKYFLGNTKKNVVVLAPTGVAAINVGGQTIHSFFRFGIDITLDKVRKLSKREQALYKAIDTIVIDEVSMVRADIMDCIDKFMRLNGRKKNQPFGGVQMILVGDIYQLPPVVRGIEKEIFESVYESPYFFSSNAFKEGKFTFIELEKIFRQQDRTFIEILNKIRNNTIDNDLLKVLNQRVDLEFMPSEKDTYIVLTTLNAISDWINQSNLSRIDGELYTFTGRISGEFDEQYLPTDMELNLKVGAQVMLINNDPEGRWVNGTIGRVVEIDDERDSEILVELENGEIVDVKRYRWKIIKYTYDRENKRITTEEVGSFTQFPIILAWAITIHKSQGKTFEKVIIDIGRGTFAHGQLYVALSRCRSLNGIVLRRPVEKRHIIMDRRVVRFATEYQYRQSEEYCSKEEKIKILSDAIRDGREIMIVYLKTNDDKTRRRIKPLFVGEIEYNDRKFIGLKALDLDKNEERHFKIERILEIEDE